MLLKTNYHTHSSFCDGKNTAEGMILSAKKEGLKILGFSSHTTYPFAAPWDVQPSKIDDYCKTIRFLAQKYAESIEILLGFEVDYLPPLSYPQKNRFKDFNPDFLIGSVHHLSDEKCKKEFFSIDASFEAMQKGIKRCFNGNSKKAVQMYFSRQREMIKTGDFDIVGHIDVIRKRNSNNAFFNEEDSWYKRELIETAKAAHRQRVIVEINTGGMARAGLKTPYPSPYFLNVLCKQKVPITINSDAHKENTIAFGFSQAAHFARVAGFRETLYLSKGSWKATAL